MQHAMEYELQSGMAAQQAIGAAGVVMDVRTGEILAIASLPDFDPNRPPSGNDVRQFNRATQGSTNSARCSRFSASPMRWKQGRRGSIRSGTRRHHCGSGAFAFMTITRSAGR
ncbi:penicillin-binding transpeptidase domain-containing protein [Hankyongella ginsenosidimutans]|uniref:penicillin-binding transpeptidase domain-containing protein n=1 Tax=Hankyongella ginsenosidimutans TaxID=1763828 RepID=UPI001FE277A8|nr:penicillin-binding transpeptidase domain-containing protein [Hankyongella ginsenosidimutans]